MKECIHSVHDADCKFCLQDMLYAARTRINCLESILRDVKNSFANVGADMRGPCCVTPLMETRIDELLRRVK